MPPHFYSDLKDNIISQEEHENVKKFWRIMNFENFGKVNKIYNFQDTKFLARYLSHAMITFKNYLNIIHVNVILQVFSVGAHKDIRVNAT